MVTTKEIKKYRKLLRRKRAAAFVLAFSLYIGLLAVDNAGSEMTGYPGALALKTKRIDLKHLEVSFLGREALVDTEAIVKKIDGTKKMAQNTVSNIYASLKSTDSKINIEDIQALMPGKTL